MSEQRVDALTGEAVILAPGRGARPHLHDAEGPATKGCPFCPGNEGDTPPSVMDLSLTGRAGWFVRVFPNRFPIVTPSEGPAKAGTRRANGTHEIIVETPLHDQEIADRTPEELMLTLQAYRERLRELQGRPGIRYVSVFHNSGAAAGASLPHPHSQVVALSYVPRAVRAKMRRWRRHHARTGRCLLCDALAAERDQEARVVSEPEGYLLYAPQGSVMPGELVLAPLRHEPGFEAIADGDLPGLSRALIGALGRLRTALGDPSYNLVLQTWPATGRDDSALHWYLRIVPRREVIGGFELATGDYVSTLTPEESAAMYREAAS